MKLLKNSYPASSAVRLSEKLTIVSDYAGSEGSINLVVPNAGVYTPDGKSLELWLLRDGAGMRVFAFEEVDARTIQIDRSVLALREEDVLFFIEYYGYVDQDEENTEKMLGLEKEMQRLTEEMEDYKSTVLSECIPVGFGYIQFATSPLPGNTLLDNEGEDISSDFTDDELNNCMYNGTSWQLAVRAGDFLRQVGTRTNDDELEIGSADFGETQEDQFQGHYHVSENNGAGPGAASGDDGENPMGAYQSNVAVTVSIQEATSDGTNGTPRTGYETRPVNTAVRFWVRVA